MKRILRLFILTAVFMSSSKLFAQSAVCINVENSKNKLFYSLMFKDSLADKRTTLSLDELVSAVNEKGADPDKEIELIAVTLEGDPKAEMKLFKKAMKKLKEHFPKLKAIVFLINEGYGDVSPNEKAAEGTCERCKTSLPFLNEFAATLKDANPTVKVFFKCN